MLQQFYAINQLFIRQEQINEVNKSIHRSLLRRIPLNNEKISSESITLPKKLIKFVFTMLCAFCCVYNAYQIVSNYLEYPVAAEVWFYSTKPVTPPMVTFCVRDNYREPCEENCYNSSRLFFEKTYNFSEIVKSIHVHQEPIGKVPFNDTKYFDANEVITFGIYDKVCYAIDITEHNNTNITYSINYVKSLTSPDMLMILFNCSACSRPGRACEVLIATPGSLYVQPIGKQAMAGQANLFTYKHLELHLMPPPYATKCRDYAPTQDLTQEDCFTRCVKQRSLKELGYVTPKAPIFIKDEYAVKFDAVPDKIMDSCKNLCSEIACEIHQYTVDVERAVFSSNDTFVIINIPMDGKILANYKEKINIWDFFTLFGSVFGFWFGVSAIGILDPLMNMNWKRV